jgi:septal ring factor EnvC (AmiA/AmiB activator)
MRKQMKTDSDGMTRKVSECNETVQKLAQQQKTFVDKINKMETEIADTAEKMKQMVDEYKCKLLSELEAVKKKREKQIENAREEVERMLSVVENFQKYSGELSSKGTACDISRTASGLHVRAKELMEFDVSREFDATDSSVDVKFTSHLSVDELQRMFGELEI